MCSLLEHCCRCPCPDFFFCWCFLTRPRSPYILYASHTYNVRFHPLIYFSSFIISRCAGNREQTQARERARDGATRDEPLFSPREQPFIKSNTGGDATMNTNDHSVSRLARPFNKLLLLSRLLYRSDAGHRQINLLKMICRTWTSWLTDTVVRLQRCPTQCFFSLQLWIDEYTDGTRVKYLASSAACPAGGPNLFWFRVFRPSSSSTTGNMPLGIIIISFWSAAHFCDEYFPKLQISWERHGSTSS